MKALTDAERTFEGGWVGRYSHRKRCHPLWLLKVVVFALLAVAVFLQSTVRADQDEPVTPKQLNEIHKRYLAAKAAKFSKESVVNLYREEYSNQAV